MKIGIVFPGSGSQFVGMGKDFYDDHRIVQEYFEEAYNCLNINFIKLCFASSDQELARISNSYPALFLVSTSLFSLLNEKLKEKQISPSVIAGYGIGQYSAIFAAGGMTFPDGLYLLKKYSGFFEELLPGMDSGILKVSGLSSLKLKKIINKYNLTIAAYDTDSCFVISGKNPDLEEFKLYLKSGDNKFLKISKYVSGMGTHSELMSDVVTQYSAYLEKVDFKDPNITLLSNLDCKELSSGKKVKDHIIKQISSPIKWNGIMSKLDTMDLIIEIGPGTALSEMIKVQYPDKQVMSFNKKSDLEDLVKILDQNSNIILDKSLDVQTEVKQEQISNS